MPHKRKKKWTAADNCSLAYAQLYLLLAHTFRFFDMELYDTTRERDIDIKGGGPLGEPTRSTKGVRVRVKGVVA
jgi:hypothetical protein